MGAMVHERAPAWLDGRLVATIVVALSAVRLLVAGTTGLAYDEAYYAFWSQALSLGYLDHPPMVALMIRAGRMLFGTDPFGIRVLGVVAVAITALLVWRIGVLLMDRATAALAALLFAALPILALGFVITPDVPSVLFWAAGLWAVAEFRGSGRAGWWLVAGLAVGLGLWSKFTGGFLPLGLLAFLLSSRERRRWLLLWQVWAGVALALAVFAPLLWWSAAHGWSSFGFQGKRLIVEGLGVAAGANLLGLLGGFVLTLGPALMPVAFGTWLLALGRREAPTWSGLALPAWSSVPLLAYFVFHALHGSVEPNWPIPVAPAMALIGASGLLGIWNRRRWLGTALLILQAAAFVLAAGLLNAQLVWQPFNLGAIDRTKDTRDWPALARAIEDAANASGARWVATVRDYGLTGEIATALLADGSPLPVRQLDELPRWTFLPPLPPERAAGPALLVAPSNAPAALVEGGRTVGSFKRHDRYRSLGSYRLVLIDVPPP